VAKEKEKRSYEKRLQRIMVPMNFSTAARKAFRYAQDLAKQYRACIILLHVVVPSDAGDQPTRAVRAAKKGLDHLCTTDGVLSKRCKSLVRIGIPFSEITQSADENGVELIILSRRDSTIGGGFGEGHTFSRVVRYAKCPVLIVNESGRDFVAEPPGQ
jgi:nucleotide-binding universal stress UspA family protein